MNLMLYLGLNKQVPSTYHFALEQSTAELKNNFNRKDMLFLMYGIWSRNIDLALNKKMVEIFLLHIGGKQRSRVKAVLCKCDIQTSGNR